MGSAAGENMEEAPLVDARDTAYLLSTAIFFAACAYAQLNDPNPALWVSLYAAGGVTFNLMLLLRNQFLDTLVRGYLCPMYAVFLATLIVQLINQAVALVSADTELSSATTLQSLGWLALEHEAARDASGLAMVALHCVYLCVTQSSAASRAVFGYVMMGTVSSAAYMWYFHQAELNTRLKKAHCDGQMDLLE